MTEPSIKHRFSTESAKCASALQNNLIVSSLSAGWTSCMLDLVEGDHVSDVHETHATPDLTVVVATKGEHDVEVFTNGGWQQAVYQVGSVGLTPGGHTTRLRWRNRNPGNPFRTAHLYIPSSMVSEAAEFYRKPGQSLSPEIASTLVVSEQVASSVVASLLSALNDGAPDMYSEIAVRWLVTHLLSRFRDGAGSNLDTSRLEVLSDKRLADAIEFMTANLSQSITVDEIAREACVSPFHFSRLFRQKLGQAPHKFLTDRRMELARRLLTTTDLPISTIGLECGFPLASSFSAAFTRHFGVPPREFARIREKR